MEINSIQNGQKKISNKTAGAGALAGLVGSGAYLLKNREDIFTKNIKNAKALDAFDNRTKAYIIGIPAAFVAGTIAVATIVGKIAGVIVDKHNAKKALDSSVLDDMAFLQEQFNANNIEKTLNSDLYNGDGKYVDGILEEINYPLFNGSSNPDINIANYMEDKYPKDLNYSTDFNADVAD